MGGIGKIAGGVAKAVGGAAKGIAGAAGGAAGGGVNQIAEKAMGCCKKGKEGEMKQILGQLLNGAKGPLGQ